MNRLNKKPIVDEVLNSDFITSIVDKKVRRAPVDLFKDSLENDPVFAAWLATNPLADFLTEETDPIFVAWLATNPLGDFLTSETDPVFTAWLATNPLAAFLTEETDPMFVAWLATNPLAGFLTEETDPIAMAAIGNREYTEQNHITSGDTITKSVDDLDKAIEDFTGNTEELPTIELPTEELPSQQIIFDSEEIPEVGRQIVIEVSEDSTTYTWKLDETKVDHNNLLNYEDDRHRKMNYDEQLKAYLIEN